MSTIRSDFHTNLASLYIDDLFYQRSSIYYFLGKIQPIGNDTTVPPTTAVTSQNDVDIRDNILYLKRVTPSEVSLVTRRHDWVGGHVYPQWDHTLDLRTEPFYVVTSEFAVYKCLNNNNGALSTVEPTGTSLSPISTADGYLWKYMYSVPAFKRKKFLSRESLPVQKALTDAFYNRGAVEQVTINNSGSGYADITQVSLIVIGDGEGADLTAIISKIDGSFLDVYIENGGSGYTTAEIVVNAASGEGQYGNPEAVLKPIVFEGEIVAVTIEDPGIGYPPDISTSIIVLGDGSGASFSPIVSNGEIVDVIVDNPGQDYSYISLNVVGRIGSGGAQLTGVLSASDFTSDQSIVEQSAIPGAIYAIKLTNAGNNYTANSTVTIIGDGTGATADLVLAEDGTIDQVVMTSYGSGYTWADITFTDPNRLLPNDYTNATAYAILPPVGGHGSNAVKELYGDTLGIYSLMQDDFDLNAMAQDYRQYGLISNPTTIGAATRVSTATNIITFQLTFDNVTNISKDNLLLSNNVYYRVVSLDGTTVELQQQSQIFKAIEAGDIFTNTNVQFSQHSVASVDQVPTVDKYSGNLLYASNVAPFIPSGDQLISIRTYIKL